MRECCNTGSAPETELVVAEVIGNGSTSEKTAGSNESDEGSIDLHLQAFTIVEIFFFAHFGLAMP